jgi:putative transposase
VDTLGLIWARVVHEASIPDREGAKVVFFALMSVLTTLLLVWADQGYAGKLVAWVSSHLWGWRLEIVQKLQGLSGFHLLPHRWIVERTFAWFGNYRLLAKEYETSIPASEADLDLAMIHLMLRRLRL